MTARLPTFAEQAALRRRSPLVADQLEFTSDPEAGAATRDNLSYTQQLGALSANRFSAGIDAIQGVAQKALGFDDAANANFREFDRLERRAEKYGPDVQGLSEVFDGSEPVTASRFGQGLAAELATLAPDVAITGVGALAGTVLAPGAGTLGGIAAPTVARKAAFELAEKTAKEFAEAEVKRLATKGVVGEAAETSARLAGQDAGRLAARNMLAATPEAQAAAARAQQIGSLVGATPAGMPGIAGDAETVALAEEGTQGDAAVLLSGIVAGGMVDAIPALRALGKIGDQVTGEVVKKTTDRFLTRALKEAGIQAGAEGSTEVVQQALTNASHAIVTENPELLYNDEALKEYLISFAVGGTLGGVLGGGIEVSGAAGRQAQRTARQAWDATSRFFENRIRGPVQKDPGVEQNHAQADQTVASTRTPQDPEKLEAARERLSYGYDNARRSDEIKARAEEATRWFNNWKRGDENRRFSLDGFSNSIIRASGGPDAAVNYRMLGFVDGIDPLVKQLRSTGGDAAAADFLARSGSALYRQFTAPQTLSEQDTALLEQLNPYISPQSRDVMSSLAAEWSDRNVSLSSAYEREAADVTAGEAVAAEYAPASAAEQTQAEYEGNATEADLVFGDMQEDAEVDPVNRFVASGSAADRKAAIEFLEGPQSNNGKFRTNTFDAARNEAQFNKKRGTNGVLPYGEGKLWDATGHALRLLAQNRRDYAANDRIAPAKAALLDAFSQAQAAGLPVDFSALKPGGYRIGSETVELTRDEIAATRAAATQRPVQSRPRAELSLIRDVNNDLPPTFQGEELEVDGPELGDADYRLGPRAAPPGAEARVVTPLDGKLRGAVRDAQGNIVEHGWEVDEAAGGYRNTRDGTLVTSRAEAERRAMDSEGMVPDMAPVRGVTYRTPSEPQPAALSPEDAELKRIGAQVGADVMQGRPRILGVRSRYIEGAEPGTTRAVVTFYKDGQRTEAQLDVFNDIVGYDYKNPNMVARGRAQQRAEELAQSGAVEVSYAPADRGESALDPNLTSPDATQLLARLSDPKFNSSLKDMPADDAREYAFLVEALADLAGPDSVYAQAAQGALTPQEVWQARPVTAQRGTKLVEADTAALGRYAATKATDAELAAVKEAAANRGKDPFNASRLNVAQAQAIQQYAAQFARKLGIPHVLTRFGGFLRRDGAVNAGATTVSAGGKHFVAIHTANMKSPDPVLDDGKDALARMRRTVAHELAHVLDRLHHDITGSRLTDDPEFRSGSVLWAEVQAAAEADPVLAKAFGYILRDTDPDRAARELFSQLVATRESHPEKMNEFLPDASAFVRSKLVVAGRAAAERAGSGEGAAGEAATGTAGSTGGPAERVDAARTGDQPEPEAAGGRGRQRNSVLKDEGTMGPSGPLPAGAMEAANAGDSATSLPALPAALAPVPKSTTAKEVRDAAAAEAKAELARIRSLPPEQRKAALDAKTRRQSADPGAESVVSAPAGQHDLVAEGAYVQGIVRGMGLGPTNVTVTDNSGEFASLPSTAGEMRVNPDGSVTIAMGKDLVGLERLEVLQHEIGHVALFKHIAKTAGVELKALLGPDGKMPTTNELISKLAETDPKLYDALKADYDAWLAQNASKARGVNTMLGSRGGVARAAGRRARGGAGPRMQSMDQASVDTLMSMEEWIADGVIRALNSNTTAKTITEKFFSDLAQALRAAYDTFRAAVDTFLGRQTSRGEAMPQDAVDAVKGKARGDNPLAPPSIQKWVDGMFTAEAKRLGPTVSAGRREIIMRAADFLHRARKGFVADVETVAKAEAPKAQYAETVNSTIKAWSAVMNYALNTEQKTALTRILNRADVDEQLRSRLRNAPKGLLDPQIATMIDDVMVGPELRIALAFALQTSGNPESKMRFGPLFDNAFGDAIANVTGWLGYASDADYATAIMKAVEDGTLAGLAKKNAADPDARADFDHVKAHTDALRAAGKAAQAKAVERNEKFSQTGFGKMLTNVRDYYGRIVTQSIFDRALDSGSTNIRRIIAMLHKPGDVPGADAGLIRAAEHKIALESQKAIRALDGLDKEQQAEVLRILQEATPGAAVAGKASSPKVAAAVDKLKAQLAEFDVYARKAGMKYGYQRDFFPVVMAIDSKKAEQELADLLMQPNFEPGIRDFYNALARRKKEDALAAGFEGAENMPDKDTRPVQELVADMVQGAKREAEFSSSYDDSPRARGARHRSMAFVYKDGTPEQIAKFAELQSKDMAGILGSYFEPMTRKAEFERRFGGGRLERMLDRAKREGASDDDIAMARAAVAASMGTYGKDAEGSPVLQHVSKDLARKLAGRKSQAAIGGVMAYQNWRLLPLALLSSLTDPVLIAMRTGGDLGTAFAGIRDGLRANFTEAGREEMARMVDQIGAAADFGAEANLVYALGGLDQAPLARQSNDLLFRWNGMTWLAKATRHMALHSAHGFLSKHALRPGKHSARYMRELGLRDGDIQVETVIGAHGRPVERVKTNTGDAERDARVREALVRFVDDAVLRPNPIQSPLWHADPYMGVVTQYKGFLYAMWDQMGRRIQAEVGNGNFVGPVIAMVAYAPLAIMAMLMRETIQYGEEGNPARAGWDVVDYTGAALNNSGMLGPNAAFLTAFENDLSTDRLPVLSQLGPSFGQATNVASSAVGERSGSETFQEAIPTQVIWEKWFGTEANRQPTAQVDSEVTEPELGLRE